MFYISTTTSLFFDLLRQSHILDTFALHELCILLRLFSVNIVHIVHKSLQTNIKNNKITKLKENCSNILSIKTLVR